MKKAKEKAKVKTPKVSAKACKKEDFYGNSEEKIKSITAERKLQQELGESEDLIFCTEELRGEGENVPDFIKAALALSRADTERERERIASLGERSPSMVDPTEAYGYTKFPAPIMDYLDYVKSTKNNLGTWSDLKSFLNTTDMFWKVMRDQSLKIAIDFAQSKRAPDELIGKCAFYDKSYYREIIDSYIAELEKEKISARSSASELLLKLILGYSTHEFEVEDRVRIKEGS